MATAKFSKGRNAPGQFCHVSEMHINVLRSCPVCGHARCEILRKQRFVLPDGHPLAGGYAVVCCDLCGFVYAGTAVSQDDYDRFYREHSKYEDTTTSTGGGDTPWDDVRLHETARCIAEFLPDRAARVLDIGCANGGLLRHLAALGFGHLTGLDPAAACVQHTRSIAGIRAEMGSLSHIPAGLGTFDFVILSHVLEHVQDLHGAVAAVAQVLSASGTVYVEVPDATRYAEHVPAPFQDFNTEHINHFSLTALANLMHVAGMQVVSQGVKTLMAPPPNPYPACFAFFRRGGSVQAQFAKDPVLRRKILEYIEISTGKLHAMDEFLRAALPADQPVIVWGVGQLAMRLLAESVLGTASIAAFVDGNPIHHGRFIRGVRVSAPEGLAALPHPILIASTLHDAEITATIRQKLGLKNRIIHLDTPTSAQEQ